MTITAEDLRERRTFFYSQVEKAAQRGFKVGFASAKYKEHYGKWPPDAWSADARRMYMADAGWQARLDHRRIEAEHYEEWERGVKPIAEARKVEWMAKHAGPERVMLGVKGSIAQCYQSERRVRPIHGHILGETIALCGKFIDRWLTNRKPFSSSTEYGCKKCKAVYAKQNQLPFILEKPR